MNNLSLTLNPDTVAYWFFRLNGCSTITNFVVHPDRHGSQRTDVNVLAAPGTVPGPYRAPSVWNPTHLNNHTQSNQPQFP